MVAHVRVGFVHTEPPQTSKAGSLESGINLVGGYASKVVLGLCICEAVSRDEDFTHYPSPYRSAEIKVWSWQDHSQHFASMRRLQLSSLGEFVSRWYPMMTWLKQGWSPVDGQGFGLRDWSVVSLCDCPFMAVPLYSRRSCDGWEMFPAVKLRNERRPSSSLPLSSSHHHNIRWE